MLPRRDSKPLEYPALLPMFGGMEKKPRFLDREVVTMGRARGSDICLDGNEVSALHCIIYRATEGFRVRDCGSRTGTRVNGQGVKTGVLGNGDVLQIGPFSFEVRLPKGMSQVAAIDPFRFERMRRSRSKLAQLALGLRKKLRVKKTPPNGHGTAHESPALADSGANDKKAAELKAKIKQYDLKVNQLEASEKELCDEHEALKKQKREFEDQCKAREAAYAERQKRLEEEVQERCAAGQANGQANGNVPAPAHVDHGPDANDLQAKRQELEALERKLQARDKELNDDYKEVFKEREQVEKLKQQWQYEQLEAQKQCEQQRTAIASAEATLHDQKSQLGAMIDQLRKMQDDLRVASSGEANQLKQQVAQLKKELAEAQAQRPNAAGAQSEVAQLRDKLAASQATVESLSLSLKQTSGVSAEVEELQKEMQARQARLEEQVQTLLAENEALRRQGSEGAGAHSLPGEQESRLAQLQSENESLRSLAEQLQQHFASSDHGGHAEELATLKSEIDSLRDQLRNAEQSPATANSDNDEVRQENKVLRRLLDEAEADLRQLKNEVGGGREAATNSGAVAALQDELQVLREQLSLKDGLIAELKGEAENHPIGDPESYEAELNRFRKELEADRARLNKEIESLRLRNSELDDATRELEMELSRERAEMARERIRLDRMRDEVKADMERLQREHDVRGSLGGVQKLREEIVQKAGGPPKSASDRLRTMSKLPQ